MKSQQSQGAKFPQSAAALIVRCCLNIVFQDYALFPNLDVQHNVLYVLKNRPNNDFVRKFILNQLEIKRNNIYALFAARQRSERWCNAA